MIVAAPNLPVVVRPVGDRGRLPAPVGARAPATGPAFVGARAALPTVVRRSPHHRRGRRRPTPSAATSSVVDAVGRRRPPSSSAACWGRRSRRCRGAHRQGPRPDDRLLPRAVRRLADVDRYRCDTQRRPAPRPHQHPVPRPAATAWSRERTAASPPYVAGATLIDSVVVGRPRARRPPDRPPRRWATRGRRAFARWTAPTSAWRSPTTRSTCSPSAAP